MAPWTEDVMRIKRHEWVVSESTVVTYQAFCGCYILCAEVVHPDRLETDADKPYKMYTGVEV